MTEEQWELAVRGEWAAIVQRAQERHRARELQARLARVRSALAFLATRRHTP